MPLLQIEENIVSEPKDFKWGKEWRAIRIWKELRDDGDYFFALITRMYGPNDYGNKKDDEYWIGREVKYINERKFDTDPKSQTFGKRVDKDPEWVHEEIWDDRLHKYVAQKYAVEAKKTYKYTHKVTPELTKNYRSLVGDLPGGARTQLIFLYGSRPVDVRNHDDFWKHEVKEFRAIEEKSDSIFDKEVDRQKKGKHQ